MFDQQEQGLRTEVPGTPVIEGASSSSQQTIPFPRPKPHVPRPREIPPYLDPQNAFYNPSLMRRS